MMKQGYFSHFVHECNLQELLEEMDECYYDDSTGFDHFCWSDSPQGHLFWSKLQAMYHHWVGEGCPSLQVSYGEGLDLTICNITPWGKPPEPALVDIEFI